MKADRQRAKADLSTLGTMLQKQPVAPVDEAEAAIHQAMAVLLPFQQQILAHKILRTYQ